jgi:hypothetical protein
MTQQIINIGTVANDRTGDTWRNAMDKANDNFTELYSETPQNRITVTEASQLAGVLSSSVQYFIDGVVDMGTQTIEVPSGGLNIAGLGFGLSQLISSQPSYSMFTSPIGGSGNLFLNGVEFSVTGVGSGVFALTADTGFEAIEMSTVNFNNCESLGYIDGYRQGLELNTGRFGGTPSLELINPWAGGYRVTTSIVRSIDNAMTAPLFKAGSGFTMSSRFLTDINADLGTTAPLLDFAPANFIAPSLLQIKGAIITRNGVANAADTTITPNILASDLESDWDKNIGLTNTFEGGVLTVTAETATTVAAANTFYDLAATWSTSDLQHFDSPASGQLRHLGNDPREYRIFGDLSVVGTANDVIVVKIVKWDNSAAGFVDVGSQRRQINNLVGGRDVAFFNATTTVTLDQNDYVKLQVENQTAARNVTVELDAFWSVSER